MPQPVLGWFSSIDLANLYGTNALAALIYDQVVPRLARRWRFTRRQDRDRRPFVAICLSAPVRFVDGLLIRFGNIGVVPPSVQLSALPS